MSWFKELTSKAEAMLVKLDQDAAQALQNPEGLHKRTRPVDHIDVQEEKASESELLFNENDKQNNDNNPKIVHIPETQSYINRIEEKNSQRQPDDYSLMLATDSPQQGEAISIQYPNDEIIMSNNNNIERDSQTSPANESQQTNNSLPKKFTIRASRTNAHLFVPDKQSNRQGKLAKMKKGHVLSDGHNREQEPDTNLSSPDADDIRASINRSLQEYSIQSFSSSNNVPICTPSSSQQTTYQSHFDDQPNLIQHKSLLETGATSRIHSSPSFSIDVPEDANDGRSTDNIAFKLLQQSASKKKSTFYLHKVINRLANPNGQATEIFSDEMRIKFKRSQLRMASYVRRLNYYFRAYPMLKYLMVGYLVIMQILVIYVLFFYQSSGSSSALSTQIKQQQRELTESQLDNESNPVVSNFVGSM